MSYKKREILTQRHREDYVMMEVAVGVMQLQAKECKGLLVTT